jgi:predicted transcriptional regulator of viral defense system
MVTNTFPTIELQSEALQELTRRIQAEYAEMPGLSVTLAQAQRLLAIDPQTCAAVFRALIRRGVLRRTAQGRYVRRDP